MTLTLITPYEYEVGSTYRVSVGKHTELVFSVELEVVKGVNRWDTKQYQINLTGIEETLDIGDSE